MNAPHSYRAYNKANHTVPKTRQVVMLYDGAIRFLQQAKAAMEEGNINERYSKLVRSSDIIMGLQSCLDFEAGGDAARILYDYYSSIDMRIMTLHRTNDTGACEIITRDLKEMRDVWDRIDRGQMQPVDALNMASDMTKPAALDVKAVTFSA